MPVSQYPPVSGNTPILLGYSEASANQTTISAETALTALFVTVVVPAGRRIRISSQIQLSSATTSGTSLLRLKEGSTTLQVAQGNYNTIGGNGWALRAEVVVTPSAGVHTYNCSVQGTAGTVDMIATGGPISYILVEDITGVAIPAPPVSVPVGQLAYSEYVGGTFTIGATATETDIGGLYVNIVVPVGRTIRVTGFVHLRSSVATDTTYLRIREDGNNRGFAYCNELATNPGTCVVSATWSPAAGAHTIKITGTRASGSGSVSVYGVAGEPSFILVEDITPTPALSSGAPSSTLGYAEVLASQTIGAVSTETDITGASVTVTVPAGRRLKISAQTLLNTTVANDEARMHIKEGANWLQTIIHSFSGALWETFRGEVIIAPSAGTHTYFLRAVRQTGTGSLATYASAQLPTFILVEDITGAVWPTGTAVTAGMVASEAWTTWSPTLTQSIAVPFTLTRATYTKIGRTVIIHCNLAITGAGTSGNSITIGNLPAAAVNFGCLTGSFRYFRAGVTIYAGTTEGASTTSVWFDTSTNGSPLGISPAFATASGDTLQMTLTYEAVS